MIRDGAYLTYEEADSKLREDQEAVGLPQYEYDYKVEIVLPEEFSK